MSNFWLQQCGSAGDSLLLLVVASAARVMQCSVIQTVIWLQTYSDMQSSCSDLAIDIDRVMESPVLIVIERSAGVLSDQQPLPAVPLWAVQHCFSTPRTDCNFLTANQLVSPASGTAVLCPQELLLCGSLPCCLFASPVSLILSFVLVFRSSLSLLPYVRFPLLQGLYGGLSSPDRFRY